MESLEMIKKTQEISHDGSPPQSATAHDNWFRSFARCTSTKQIRLAMIRRSLIFTPTNPTFDASGFPLIGLDPVA